MKLLDSPDLIGNELYLASMAGGGVLRSEDMRRPPDSRVDLVPELMALVREPTFVRPSYRSIGMLGGCRSVPPIMPFKGRRFLSSGLTFSRSEDFLDLD